MANITSILSQALLKLGLAPVQSTDSPSKEMVIAQATWEFTRPALLRAYRWPFAKSQR